MIGPPILIGPMKKHLKEEFETKSNENQLTASVIRKFCFSLRKRENEIRNVDKYYLFDSDN